jgi:hypothetical protein
MTRDERGRVVLLRCAGCGQQRPVRAGYAAWVAAGKGSGRCVRCARAILAASQPPRPVVCRHCRRYAVTRPRGLCWSCHRKPDVRAQYPSESKYAKRGENFCRRAPLPPAPTPHPPGSAKKIEAMEARALAGEELFHPSDATWDEFYAGLVGGGVCDEACETGEGFP